VKFFDATLFSSRFAACALAAGLGFSMLGFLTGCNKTPDLTAPAPAAKAATQKVDAAALAVIAAEGKGFSVGPPMSARVYYVFFDAQCPHCATLWAASKPLKTQARFVWIPVGILNASSTTQGATLLAATDPAAAMDAHETSMLSKSGGITAASGIDAQKAFIKTNTELMNRYGFASIPTVVGAHAQTGEIVRSEGALGTAALAALLGLQAPGGTSVKPAI